MSADSVFQAEIRSIRSELKELKDCVDEHDVDLYRGKTANDPSVTARLKDLEGRMERAEKAHAYFLAQQEAAEAKTISDKEKATQEVKDRQKELKRMLLGVLCAIVTDIFKDSISHIWHHVFQ